MQIRFKLLIINVAAVMAICRKRGDNINILDNYIAAAVKPALEIVIFFNVFEIILRLLLIFRGQRSFCRIVEIFFYIRCIFARFFGECGNFVCGKIFTLFFQRFIFLASSRAKLMKFSPAFSFFIRS